MAGTFMDLKTPRVLIAGLAGDSGKTIVSLAIIDAFRQRGYNVSVFKKGPDYIDAAWLSRAAENDCYNLDTYMVEPETVLTGFAGKAVRSDIAVIEGNRGIFDGKDVAGTHSTAQLAKLLRAPVVLCVTATKTTRTLAAIIKGCLSFDPEVDIKGVILNKIAGKRHRNIITETIKKYCAVPVFGVLPKLEDIIPGRHLGLVPPLEYREQIGKKLEKIACNLDIDGLLKAAAKAGALRVVKQDGKIAVKTVKIGYFTDSAFTFYYPENLEALQKKGAVLVPVSSLESVNLPNVDALYIGGGFPETHARRLVENQAMSKSVKQRVEDGLPVYAECGGLIYLSRTLAYKDKLYPMAGVFPIDLKMCDKPSGHGYTMLNVDKPNPFFAQGTVIKGHEFHYTRLNGPMAAKSCMEVLVGTGLGEKRDGLLYKRCLASYTHIHADGVKSWAGAMIANAAKYKKEKKQSVDRG